MSVVICWITTRKVHNRMDKEAWDSHLQVSANQFPPAEYAVIIVVLVTTSVTVSHLVPAREAIWPGVRQSPGKQPGRLFHLADRLTGLCFLVDIRVQLIVLPMHSGDTQTVSSFTLLTGNKTAIKTYGKKSVKLNLSLGRHYIWSIVYLDFLLHWSKKD